MNTKKYIWKFGYRQKESLATSTSDVKRLIENYQTNNDNISLSNIVSSIKKKEKNLSLKKDKIEIIEALFFISSIDDNELIEFEEKRIRDIISKNNNEHQKLLKFWIKHQRLQLVSL